jgi:ribosomal protein S18 acetylase RimI-like enzyme
MKSFSQLQKEKPVEIGLAKLNSELLWLKESGRQVGSLVLVFEGNSASIYSVEVLSEFRGKGYGKKLVESAIDYCKNLRVSSLELNTETDNTVANNLYKSLGFNLEGLKDGFNNYKKLI